MAIYYYNYYNFAIFLKFSNFPGFYSLSAAKTGNKSWDKTKDSNFKIHLSKHGFQKLIVIKNFHFL